MSEPLFISPPEPKKPTKTIRLHTIIRDDKGVATHVQEQDREFDADGKLIRLVGKPTLRPLSPHQR